MKKGLLLGLIALFAVSFSNAQDCLQGEDSLKCMQSITIFDINYRSGHAQYKKGDKDAGLASLNSARKDFMWAFNNCPGCKKTVLVNGPTLLKYYIDNETDEAKKEGLIDTLLMSYDMRIQYWGDEGKAMMYKGVSLAKYRKNAYEEQFNTLNRALELQGNNMSAVGLQYYMRSMIYLVKGKKKTCEDIVTEYVRISDIIQVNRDKMGYAAAEKSILKMIGSCLKPKILVDLYEKNFDANKDNLDWLNQAKGLIKAKNCLKDEEVKDRAAVIYQKIVEAAHDLDPSFASAIALGGVFVGKDDAKAKKYIDQADSLASSDDEKVELYNTLAAMYFNQKKYSQVRTQARKALAIKKNNESYSWIAEAYGASQPRCLDMKFGGVEVYWIAVDYLYKAKAAAETEEEKAHIQKRINKISSFFPKADDPKIFMQGGKDGDTAEVGCWIGQTTTVRLKK